MRVLLAAESHLAFRDALNADDFSLFVQRMDPLVRQYEELRRPPLWWKLAKHIKTLLKKLISPPKRKER